MIALVLALLAVSFWSTNAIVAKYALQGLSLEHTQLLQFLGAATVCMLFKAWKKDLKSIYTLTKSAWLLGAIGITSTMIFQYVAFSIGPITEVNLIAYSWPLLAVCFFVMTGQSKKPILLLLLGLIGFLGVYLLITGASRGVAFEDTTYMGVFARFYLCAIHGCLYLPHRQDN